MNLHRLFFVLLPCALLIPHTSCFSLSSPHIFALHSPHLISSRLTTPRPILCHVTFLSSHHTHDTTLLSHLCQIPLYPTISSSRSSTFCSSELEEFFHAAEVLGADHRQHSIATITAQRNREKNKHTHTHNADDESYEESDASGTYSQSLIHVKKSGGGESRANSRMGIHSKDAHSHSHLSYGNTSSNSDGSYVTSSPPYTDTCNNSNSSSRGVHGEKGRTAMSAADIRNHRYNTGLLDPDSDSW